mmetsp:Transcript_125695/g.250852  ORF Transcript_125695/g.250852 Transcript_125695/m.250852 type:complete len:267 (-) Transcript_125695:472-1272(-)
MFAPAWPLALFALIRLIGAILHLITVPVCHYFFAWAECQEHFDQLIRNRLEWAEHQHPCSGKALVLSGFDRGPSCRCRLATIGISQHLTCGLEGVTHNVQHAHGAHKLGVAVRLLWKGDVQVRMEEEEKSTFLWPDIQLLLAKKLFKTLVHGWPKLATPPHIRSGNRRVDLLLETTNPPPVSLTARKLGKGKELPHRLFQFLGLGVFCPRTITQGHWRIHPKTWIVVQIFHWWWTRLSIFFSWFALILVDICLSRLVICLLFGRFH